MEPAILIGGVIVTAVTVWWYVRPECKGGHHFDDGTPTDRWKTVPYHGKDKVSVRRKYLRSCQHEGCWEVDDMWKDEFTMDSGEFCKGMKKFGD